LQWLSLLLPLLRLLPLLQWLPLLIPLLQHPVLLPSLLGLLCCHHEEVRRGRIAILTVQHTQNTIMRKVTWRRENCLIYT
jgi:hypothetical protein